MIIKVLGPGCAKCKEAEDVVRKAVDECGNAATVEKVTDFKEMMALGVMSTPAVVLEGQVMCTGRVPAKDEVKTWLAEAAGTAANCAPTSCGPGCCAKN